MATKFRGKIGEIGEHAVIRRIGILKRIGISERRWARQGANDSRAWDNVKI